MPRPPATCNAGWDRAERDARAWATRSGLATGERATRRLARMAHGRMAGWLAPHAGPAELSLLACWGAFISLVDDAIDRDDDRRGPDEVAAVMDALVAVVAGSPAAADRSIPAVRALADLWQRTTPSSGVGWADRFAGHYRQFAEATCEETRLRASGVRLDLRGYLALRRHTITVLPILDIVERGLAIEADALDGLRTTVADTVALVNDLASAPRELDEDSENVVTVVAREQGCDRHEAAAIARSMLAARMEDFDEAVSALAAAGLSQARLEPRIARIRDFRDGSVAWQGETHRNDPARAPAAGPSPRDREPASAAGPSPRDREPASAAGPSPGDPASATALGAEPLARHLSLAVAAGGAVTDRCASRVLESALLLALLRATGAPAAERDRLSGFLRDRRAGADDIDALLIDACLEPAGAADRDPAIAAPPQGLSRGTAGRGRLKEVMLRTVLHLLGGAALDWRDAPASPAPGAVTTFTEVHVAATRVIHAHASGYPHSVAAGERQRLIALLEAGRDRLLWEASATTHLLGLHAVQAFAPKHRVVTDGVLRATLAQNADGGVPFLDSQDLWLAAVAGLPFLRHAGLRPLTGRMADLVAAWQAPDGGWPFATGMRQTDVDTAARCMEFLRAADPQRYRVELERGTAYLLAMAGPGGGFPTWVRADEPDLDMTAGAILALAPQHGRHRDLLAAATSFVLDAQLPDGTFERSWTISESSAILRAVDALDAVRGSSPETVARRIDAAIERSVSHLAATQQADGGWGRDGDAPSDVLSTAQAVPAVAGHGAELEATRGLAYLLSRQESDGGFTSVPDQVGPRPLAFDFPVLADIHALSAFQRAGELAGVAARAGRRRAPRPRPAGGGGEAGWRGLEARLRGVLLLPQDAAYEHARLVVNQRYDAVRPQALAYPACVEDVVECVTFARERAVALTLRSGGHSYAGYSTGPGLVLDVGSLNATSVRGGRALFGAGVRGMQAHLALAAAGAGLPLGRCPTIGLAGVTLGGGLSAFTRKWGLACDRLRGAQIVTADGQVRRVSAASEPPGDELFWALCGGGGGNFGVVCELDFATEDIRDLSFASFLVAWPASAVAAVIRGWSIWNADPDLPREVRSAFEQLSDTGAPSRPTVTGTFIGTTTELQRVLDGLVAAVGGVECERLVVPCSYVQAAAEPERWGAGTWGPRVAFAAKSHIVRAPMTRAAAADMAAAIERLHDLAGVGGAGGLLIDALGGAVADRAPAATAFPHRTAVGVVQYHSYWTQLTEERHVAQRLRWLRDIHATMQRHLGTGGYTNGMDPELHDWPVAYHAGSYPRLQRVKAIYDPDQLFDFPQAVTPGPGRFEEPDDRVPAGAGSSAPGDRAPARVGSSAPGEQGGLRALAATLRGRLLVPADDGFDAARRIRNRRYDHVRPRAIAQVADERDVAACLSHAAEAGVEVAIRAGAHNYAGYCTGSGLVIDVTALDGLEIEHGRVRLGSGLDSMQAARRLARAGLAIPVARWGTVGVAGLALGGGKSAFTRAWGLTCDRLVGATIVTPDGRVRRLTAAPGDPDAELLWALRGAGGGNFGVVTALDFAAIDIGRLRFARFVVRWSGTELEPAIAGWQRWLADPGTPREVCSDMQLMLSGDAAAQPTVHGAWIGGVDALRAVLDRLVEAVGSAPAQLTMTPCDYVHAAMAPANPLEHTGARRGPAPAGVGAPPSAGRRDRRFAWAGKSHIVREIIDGAALSTLVTAVEALHVLGATGGVYLDSLGGAVTDLAPGATAFPHREAHAVLQYIVSWDGDGTSPEAISRTDWLRATHAAMAPHLGTGAYVNDTDPELVDWQRAYYGDNYPRLQRVKATYDPRQVLDFPQAVAP